AVVGAGDGTHLLYSPGRIDPASGAWENSRKPLAGEFLFDGHRVFMVANHFVSKLGDEPLWGSDQPPVRGSEVQRHRQAQEVTAFVTSLLGANPAANVIVLGDLNDFHFADTVSILKGAGLQALLDTLPSAERYTYVFDGNSQAIDHILMGGGLAPRPFAYDVVHVNSEFAAQVSDHDPQVAGFTLDPPTLSAGGPYAVGEGSSVELAATGTDASGGALRFRWDLDGDGAFETAGATAVFSAAVVDGPATRTVRVEATAPDGATATDSATILVQNVAPTAAFAAPASVFAGDAFTLAVSSIADPSAADTAAGFTVAFDCGDGH